MFTKEAIEQLQQSDAIYQARVATLEAITLNETAIVALPSDFKTHDLETFMPKRRRARGSMTTSDLLAFAAYAKAHSEPGSTVFVDAKSMSATAVLNLGTPNKPGHADNTAKLSLVKTAAFTALEKACGTLLSQQQTAEFFEDWVEQLKFFASEDSTSQIAPPKAIAAVRKITIENLRKLESQVQSLSANKSAFESVAATSTDSIPTLIYFNCQPYDGLQDRLFVLRLGIRPGDNLSPPGIVLRIIKLEQHQEQMARELADKVRDQFGDTPVHVGTYSKA